jgi:hypothetical protein
MIQPSSRDLRRCGWCGEFVHDTDIGSTSSPWGAICDRCQYIVENKKWERPPGETEEEHVVVIKQGGTDPRTGYRERSQVKCLYCLQTGTRRALSHDPDCIHSHVDVKLRSPGDEGETR